MAGQRKGLNRCEFIGFLGADPEMKYTPSGRPVATLSLGVTRRWQDKSSGEWQKDTQWVPIVAWGDLAEWCAKRLTKGNCVYVEGRWQTRSWDKPDGSKGYKTEIVASDVNLLERKEQGQGVGDELDGEADLPALGDPADDELPF